ncbi:DUF11 domain-containing protein [Kitasatospora phosalacinea]|uniref:DUF11 domain-containing protein n=1 Tax=Kitasatospora phosalacinea TaxID=2065 RepID=UPI0035D81115
MDGRRWWGPVLAVAVVATATSAHADDQTAASNGFEVTMSPASAKSGETVTFTVTTTNRDPNSYRIMNFALRPTDGASPFAGPGTCTVVSGRTPSTCGLGPNGNVLAVTFGDNNRMPPHAWSKVTITATVAQDVKPGEFRLTPDGRTSQNLDQPLAFTPRTLNFTVSGPPADLAVALRATAPTAPGGPVTYTQTVTDNGPVTDATVTTRLPAQTTSVAGLPEECAFDEANKTLTCTTGPLEPGESIRATFQATLSGLPLGPLPATATRTSSTPDGPESANDTATATCTVLTGLVIRC